MTEVFNIDSCRLCQSTDLIDLFSLGEQSLTGVFVSPEDEDPARVPLEMVLCNGCKFLQLRKTVDPDSMYEKYYYRSGTNQTMRDHLAGIAKEVENRMSLKEGDAVLDIGCNDGTLLNSYSTKDLLRVGVDPNDIIGEIKDQSIVTINNFFSKDAVISSSKIEKFDVITSISMFYDLHDPHSFIKDIYALLDENGIWVVEMNYTANMIENMGYDMISHEHVAYYTVNTFQRLVEMNGFSIVDISFNSINSGSVRLFIGKQPVSSEVTEQVIERELELGLETTECYANFAKDIEVYREKLIKVVRDIQSDGKSIFVYGASTRGNTILQHCKFDASDFPYAADRNPKKWGLITAGSRIPIISEDEARNMNPDYFLILPYSFMDEFIMREREFLEKGGKFIVPLPELQILSMRNGNLIVDDC